GESRRHTNSHRTARQERGAGYVRGSHQAVRRQDDQVLKTMAFKSETVAIVAVIVLCFGHTAAHAQTRGCQLPPQFPCPDARIMEFKADKLSAAGGQTVVLR